MIQLRTIHPISFERYNREPVYVPPPPIDVGPPPEVPTDHEEKSEPGTEYPMLDRALERLGFDKQGWKIEVKKTAHGEIPMFASVKKHLGQTRRVAIRPEILAYSTYLDIGIKVAKVLRHQSNGPSIYGIKML